MGNFSVETGKIFSGDSLKKFLEARLMASVGFSRPVSFGNSESDVIHWIFRSWPCFGSRQKPKNSGALHLVGFLWKF